MVLYVLIKAAGNPPAPERADFSPGFAESFVMAIGPRPAPQTPFIARDGTTHRLADHAGRVVLVNLWATWCGPCVRELPSLDRLQARLGSPRFEVVAISLDQEGINVAADYLARYGLTHLDVYNEPTSAIADAFGVEGLPTSILLTPEGLEIGRYAGPAEWDGAAAETFLKAWLR